MQLDPRNYTKKDKIPYVCPECKFDFLLVFEHKKNKQHIVYRCPGCFSWFEEDKVGLKKIEDDQKAQDKKNEVDFDYLNYVDSMQMIGEEPLSRSKWYKKYTEAKERMEKEES